MFDLFVTAWLSMINSSGKCDGGLWDMRSSATRPVTHAETVIYPTVIGLRAAVAGSVAKSDWLGALGPAESGSALSQLLQ